MHGKGQMEISLLASFADTFNKVFIKDDRWKLYVEGLGNTLIISLIAVLIGVVIGLLIAVVKNINENTGKFKILNWLGNVYVTVLRGIPVMLQLLIIYGVILASWENRNVVAAIAFGLNSGAYVAEIFRSGLNSIDKGQMEAGRSLGLSYGRTMFKVVIPQALRNAIPPLGNEFIALIKETAIVGTIGIYDLTKAADKISGVTFELFMPLMISAVFYLVVVLGLSGIMKLIEKRLRKSENK